MMEVIQNSEISHNQDLNLGGHTEIQEQVEPTMQTPEKK